MEASATPATTLIASLVIPAILSLLLMRKPHLMQFQLASGHSERQAAGSEPTRGQRRQLPAPLSASTRPQKSRNGICPFSGTRSLPPLPSAHARLELAS